MQKTIINLKQRIKDNKQALLDEYGDNCELAIPTLEMIDLLLSVNASNEKIKSYLQSVDTAIKIIEEKLKRVEKKKR